MNSRPERPAQGPLAHPSDPASAATEPSILRGGSSRVETAERALSECVSAISLVQVTVYSLESQDIACPEQDVLNRAIQALWSVHDWIHDQMWPKRDAERGSGWECRP